MVILKPSYDSGKELVDYINNNENHSVNFVIIVKKNFFFFKLFFKINYFLNK
jgi:hypothetical protein